MLTFLGQLNPWAGIDVSSQLVYFSPMIILVCTMLVIVACPIVLGRGPRLTFAIAAFGVLATFLAAWRVSGMVADGGISGISTTPSAGILLADSLSIWFQMLPWQTNGISQS